MDFQKILELASKNQKVNEQKVKETKRYSSKVPPPKKEPRPAVDPDAIRARIDQKEKDKQQKLIDAERERKEGAARYAELEIKLATEKRNNRRKSRKAKPSPDPKVKKKTLSEDSSRRGETSSYRDKEHEVVHKTFMQRVEKDADKHRVKVAKKETAAKPPKPKPKKKAAPIPKKPMSYEELLKFAEQQKAGSSSKRNEEEEEEDEDSEEEESEEEEDYDRRPMSRDMGSFNRNRDQSRESKVKERLKEERSRNTAHSSNHKNIPAKHGKSTSSQSFNTKDRNRPPPNLIKNGKGPRQSSEAERNIIRKGSGPSGRDGTRKEGNVHASQKPSGGRVGGSGEDRRKMNGSMPSRAGGKQPNRTADHPVSKIKEKTSRSDDKRPAIPTNPQRGKSSDKLPRRPDSKLPPRPGERLESRPQGRPESRPIPGKSSRPGESRDGRDRDRPRPMNHDRERPRPSVMGPPRGHEVTRKRPAKPPIMHVKRGRVMVSDSEESDYDDGDGFIDDTPLDDGRGADVSSYIKEIFGYDKSKYGYESDYALRAMDASYKDIEREESRSARLGMLEDLEDMRKEKEDMKRKALKKGKKR